MGWRKWNKYNKAKKISEIEEPTIWDHMLSHEKSFIYIMSSEANKGLLKIGKTERTPEERAQELSRSTSTPFPFRVEYYYCIPKELLNETELTIHRQLKKSGKHAGKEFFSLSTDEAKRYIEDVLKCMGILDIALAKLNEFGDRVNAHNLEVKQEKERKAQLAEEKEKLDVRNQFIDQCSSDIQSVINDAIYSKLKSAKILKLSLALLTSPSRLMAPIWKSLGDTFCLYLFGSLYVGSPFIVIFERELFRSSTIIAYIRDYIYVEPLRAYLMSPPLGFICFVLSWGYFIRIWKKKRNKKGGLDEQYTLTLLFLSIPHFVFAVASNEILEIGILFAPFFTLLYSASFLVHLFFFYRPTSEWIENAITDAYKNYISVKMNNEVLGIKPLDIQAVVKAVEDGKTNLNRLKGGEIELYFPGLKNYPT